MRIVIEHCKIGNAALEIVTETGNTYRIEVEEGFAVLKGEADFSAIEVWRNGESIYNESPRKPIDPVPFSIHILES